MFKVNSMLQCSVYLAAVSLALLIPRLSLATCQDAVDAGVIPPPIFFLETTSDVPEIQSNGTAEYTGQQVYELTIQQGTLDDMQASITNNGCEPFVEYEIKRQFVTCGAGSRVKERFDVVTTLETATTSIPVDADSGQTVRPDTAPLPQPHPATQRKIFETAQIPSATVDDIDVAVDVLRIQLDATVGVEGVGGTDCISEIRFYSPPKLVTYP